MLLCLWAAQASWAQTVGWEFEALPGDGLFAVPVADTRSPLSSVVLRFDPDSPPTLGTGQAIDATLAAELRLLEARQEDWTFQVALTASAHMGFEADAQLTFGLRTFDGWFALPFDIARGPWSARVGWVHVSAHYADGIRNASELPEERGSYSREAIVALLSRTIGVGRVYGGGHFNIHTVHQEAPWMVQLGTEVEGPGRRAPYGAVDLKFHQEHSWEPTLSGQVGLRSVGDAGRFRFAAVVYAGKDDTGKYLGLDERYMGLMMGFDTTGLLRSR